MSHLERSAEKMKRKQKVLLPILGVVIGLALLAATSYYRTQRLDLLVVKPTLDPFRTYVRSTHFTIIDPWTSLIPFWTIYYAEEPTDITYTSPSIGVDLFGRIVSAPSKEVWTALDVPKNK